MKLKNRITQYFRDAAPTMQPEHISFCVPPFQAATPNWQIQLYQTALEQARHQLQAAADDWLLTDWCL